MDLLDLAARTAIVAVFAIAAGGKLRSRAAFDAFAQSLTGVVPGPPARRRAVAAATTAAEVLTVLLLLLAPTTPLGYAAATALLTVFAVGILRAVRRGTRVRCRCFGAVGGYLTRAHAARNLVLAAAAIAGLAANMASGTAETSATAVAIGTGLLVALIAVRLDDLLYLFGRPTNGNP